MKLHPDIENRNKFDGNEYYYNLKSIIIFFYRVFILANTKFISSQKTRLCTEYVKSIRIF